MIFGQINVPPPKSLNSNVTINCFIYMESVYFSESIKRGENVYYYPFKGTDSTISTPYKVDFPKGTFLFELCGASGGGPLGGKGGFTTGTLKLDKPKTLYLYIGGEGISYPKGGEPCDGFPQVTIKGGWNGGGYSVSYGFHSSGGGSTDIRLTENNEYKDRILVSGGGGGAPSCDPQYYIKEGFRGGGGGPLEGGGATGESNNHNIAYGKLFTTGGTQTEGGKAAIGTTNGISNAPGMFGVGGNSVGGNKYSGGGGGGYYGGAGGFDVTGGGGGSSYYDPNYIIEPSFGSGNFGNGSITIFVLNKAIMQTCDYRTFYFNPIVFSILMIIS